MSAHPSPGPSSLSLVPSRHKQKPLTIGIAAGAEDAKYQAKYKELKRKDNDKLHLKVLQAKQSIQRMKLEQACVVFGLTSSISLMFTFSSILYERLALTPTPIDAQNRHGPPPGVPVHPSFSRSHSGSHHYQDMGDNHQSLDSERPMRDHGVPHDRARIASGPDSRSAPVMAPMGPGMAPQSHMSGMHSPPRRASGGPGHESSRHLSHMPPLPPPAARPHVSPTIHHSHSGSSHERTRSHSSSRSRTHQQPYIPGHPHPYADSIPPVQQPMHSPPIQERERSRRHENHEGRSAHTDQHPHARVSSFAPRHSPPPDGRSSSRAHHQRLSPGPYAGRDDPYDHQPRGHESDRDREWDREHRERERERDRDRSRDLGRTPRDSHMVSPQLGHRSRQPMDRGDYPEPSRVRSDDPVYYRDAPPPGAAGYPLHSRSGSPVSGSGSGGANDAPSRPDSRHYYEQGPQQPQERTRGYRLRPVNPPNEDLDFVHEDGRSLSSRGDRGGGSGGGPFPPPEQGRPILGSRKRGRNEMDVDSDDAGEGPAYGSGRAPEDRGKRYHREHRRSLDNQEDGRMGPP
ncbi:hypothetical protein H0H81_011581 [Sphagnurus paluster]|uniref:Uncharacterized protein n=1 Tax=Sphagnurus paluster TaxID=117069 RepID=A0A9P7GR06_9AGAR|nr:hypothetical protein H0H81_011581 [Sphagnurus paluster]